MLLAKRLIISCFSFPFSRFSAFGPQITYQEAHVLDPWLVKSTNEMRYQKTPIGNTFGESIEIKMNTITSMDTMFPKQIGCVTLIQHFHRKVKTWLHVKSQMESISTQLNPSCPIRNYLSGIAENSPKD